MSSRWKEEQKRWTSSLLPTSRYKDDDAYKDDATATTASNTVMTTTTTKWTPSPRFLRKESPSLYPSLEDLYEATKHHDDLLQQQEATLWQEIPCHEQHTTSVSVPSLPTPTTTPHVEQQPSFPTVTLPLCVSSTRNVEDVAVVTASMDDLELVREQARLWDEIQQERTRSLHVTNSTSLSPSVLTMEHCSVQPKSDTRETCHPDDSSLFSKHHDHYEDRITHINGQRLHIHGMRHVYPSIAAGTAQLVPCPNCHTVLQVSANTTRLVYCTACHQVSPTDHESSLFDNGACLFEQHSSLVDMDAQIAASVQRLEHTVAHKLKEQQASSNSIHELR